MEKKTKYEIYATFKKWFEVTLSNQIHDNVSIRNQI